MDRETAIANALAKLNVLPKYADALPREAHAIVVGSNLLSVNRLPRARNSQKVRGAEAEIETVARLAAKLGKHILGMHSDSLRALESAACKPHPLALVDDLKATVIAAVHALDHAEFPAPKKGAPEDTWARPVSDRLCASFEALTGQRATVSTYPDTHPRYAQAYGPFLDMVRECFAVLGIDASPESQARAAVRRRRAKEKSREEVAA